MNVRSVKDRPVPAPRARVQPPDLTATGSFDRIVRDGAYREEAQAWLDFYHEHVVAVRPVYFDPDVYQRHYATDRQTQQFITLMADPIHPNAIGHHVLADALAPLVCPATR